MSQAFQELLSQLGNGNRAALDEMMPVVYAEMRRLAGGYMRGEHAGHTLQPTALVHEAYLRLVGQRQVDWRNRAQVLGLAARMMRRVLLDHADRRNAAKRKDAQGAVTLSLAGTAAGPNLVELIDLDRALKELSLVDERLVALVELRFFGGLTIEEAATVLEISPATTEREWATARMWLRRKLSTERRG
jgi:RNA polymerase sigma-70 factor (ECF subfamily)